ncbi:MAG: alanine--tRNA ligase [Candidatus Levybacteria bacterium]|nr:alanine--tRNA ligase [Candidatus Levybacteria bacterium]
MTASQIIQKHISFFEKRGHKRISNSPLVPENDPTTLFTSSGMQPLVPYLLGEPHPQGKRLANVQNCFRAQDIDEAGDNRHTTFFRMLGNWSLGDYFKKEQLPWFFEFLTKELGLSAKKLYVSVFEGYQNIPRDEESETIWKGLFEGAGIDPEGRIFYYSAEKNWWSRAGEPEKMPSGEPGGPDSEVFYEFDVKHDLKYGKKCHPNCQCGKFMEIGNSVFMQYQKKGDGAFVQLPQRNVDFGGGLERLLAAVENQNDIFQTTLFNSIVRAIELTTGKSYRNNSRLMRIVTDHFVAAAFIAASGVAPSNKEQGYILRRLIRRGLDNFYQLEGKEITPILELIVEEYKETNLYLVEKFEKIKGVLLEEEEAYKKTLHQAKRYIEKKYRGKQIGDELKGVTEVSSDDAFTLYTTHGLSPTQIKSLGYTFDEQAFAEKMKAHQEVSRKGMVKKFHGGLADHQEKTIRGHTATHLLHQAIRDVLGKHVHQTGSNITTDRIRFDFNYDKKVIDEELKKIEEIVNQKIKENLAVHFEILPTEEAKKVGAIGLFEDTYQDKSKIYFIGGSTSSPQDAYSVEFCGGPHVDFTGRLKRFKIIKQENIGRGQRRIYAALEN